MGLLSALVHNPDLAAGDADAIEGINIVAYVPAYSIIGDPAKQDPKTRLSADLSMAFISPDLGEDIASRQGAEPDGCSMVGVDAFALQLWQGCAVRPCNPCLDVEDHFLSWRPRVYCQVSGWHPDCNRHFAQGRQEDLH